MYYPFNRETMFLHLPAELLTLISTLLSYSDLISLKRVCKKYNKFLDEEYWKNRLPKKEIPHFSNKEFYPYYLLGDDKPNYLSWQGAYVKYITREMGFICKGSENFTSLFICINRAYQCEDDALLIYFIRNLMRNKKLLTLNGCYEHEDKNILKNILRSSILDSREETFIRVKEEASPFLLLDRLSYYSLARHRGLYKICNSLITERCNTIIWMHYALKTRDRHLFETILPFIKGRDLGRLEILLDTYFPWPEVRELVVPYLGNPVTLHSSDLSLNFTIPTEAPYGAWPSLSGILRDIANRDYEKIREYLASSWHSLDIKANLRAGGSEDYNLLPGIYYISVPNLGKFLDNP